MDSIHFAILFVLTLQISIDLSAGECNGDVSVATNYGVVIGQQLSVPLAKNANCGNETVICVNEWLGIPFAEPPISELRFKLPLAAQNWTQPLNATQQPCACIQNPIWPDYQSTCFSEDCLYLNIWQPVTPSADSLKCVVVFIYGGGLLTGSINQRSYDGRYLSSAGDVVVVTIAYRLGILGFLNTGTDDAPGNVGLWDMALALKWIKENIVYFGGNPDCITVSGQSGGSIALSYLICSNQSYHYFNNAILMSGAMNLLWAVNATQAQTNYLVRARTIGCANATDTYFTPQIIDCLKTINTSSLLSVNSPPQITIGDTIGVPFVTDSPKQLLKSGKCKPGINLLCGNCQNEGSIFTPNTPVNRTRDESIGNLIVASALIPVYEGAEKVDGALISKVYYGLTPEDFDNYDELRLIYSIALGDGNLLCETLYFCEQIFLNDPTSKVYQYYYTALLNFVSAYQTFFGPTCASWKKACHGVDLYPMFGRPIQYCNESSDIEIYASYQLIYIFTQFAKHGYPPQQLGVDWLKYFLVNCRVVKPYLQINNTHDTADSFFRYDLKCTECDKLWRPYIYVDVPN